MNRLAQRNPRRRGRRDRASGARAEDGPGVRPQMAQLLFVQNAAGVEIGAGGKTLMLKNLGRDPRSFSSISPRRGSPAIDRTRAGTSSSSGRRDPAASSKTRRTQRCRYSRRARALAFPTPPPRCRKSARVNGNDLAYDITARTSGTLPPAGAGPASPLIDIIGLPFTPAFRLPAMARRTAYRTVVWGGAAAASAAAASAYAHPYYPYYLLLHHPAQARAAVVYPAPDFRRVGSRPGGGRGEAPVN